MQQDIADVLRARELPRVGGPHASTLVHRRLAHGLMLHRWRALRAPSKPLACGQGRRPEAPAVAARASLEPMLESPPLPSVARSCHPVHAARGARLFARDSSAIAAGLGGAR